jgi:hypothetical protein
VTLPLSGAVFVNIKMAFGNWRQWYDRVSVTFRSLECHAIKERLQHPLLLKRCSKQHDGGTTTWCLQKCTFSMETKGKIGDEKLLCSAGIYRRRSQILWRSEARALYLERIKHSYWKRNDRLDVRCCQY